MNRNDAMIDICKGTKKNINKFKIKKIHHLERRY